MIYSRLHNFLYVRGRKTASTSIEIALSTIAGPDDVITPISPRDELIRSECGGRASQNFETGAGTLRNHSSITEWIGLFGGGSDTFRFTVERDPWEKVVSLWFHRYKSAPRPSMSEFIASGEAFDAINWGLYTVDDSVAVDQVVRYEALAQGLSQVAEKLGLVEFPSLPHAKAQFRPSQAGAREMLGEDEAQAIAKGYSQEIRCFGYEW